MRVYNSSRQAIDISDSPLAKAGGEGAAYKIPSRPKYCAKIYHPDKRDKNRQKKLEFMVTHAPSPLITSNYIICWPTEVLYDAKGNFMGFIMPLAFDGSDSAYDLCVGNKNLNSKWQIYYDRKSPQGILNRLKLLVNITVAINAIHQMGKYVLVDFKPQNMLATPQGGISIIDLDSVQINDGRQQYLCPVMTPDYFPPELQNDKKIGKHLIDKSCDLFALAVVYYQILYGIHPFQCSAEGTSTLQEKISSGLFVFGSNAKKISVIPPPHNKFKLLPSEIQNLFKNAFSMNPSLRPDTQTWGKTMYDFIIKVSPKK